MSLEANKDLIRTYVETVFNQRQVERADQLVVPDYVDHAALPGQAPGLEGAKRKWAMYLAGIPDLRVTIEELVAEGDNVAVRRSYAAPTEGSCWVSRLQPTVRGCGVMGFGRGLLGVGSSRRPGWDGTAGEWSGRCRG